LHRFKNLIVAFFFIGFVGEMAMACPGSLRAFNKKLDGKNSCILEETIVGQLTLTSGFNYVVLGPVFIGSEIREKQGDGTYKLSEPVKPATLTIQPGVQIYALNPTKDKSGFWNGVTLADGKTPAAGDIKSFISVTRDSRIEVQGTEAAPVKMTSGQGAHLASSNVQKNPGDWGGLVINGYGKSNKCVTFKDCTLPGEANTGYYGGDDDEHSSGSIKYLQVEYGGDRIDDKKELNGVTFNAVGVGTIIDNLAVLFNSDDCIEFFGGAAIGKNIFCYKGLDDGIDTTDGARIFLQNGIVVASDFLLGGDNDRHAVEADSSKNDDAHQRLASAPLLVNFTFVGGQNSQGFKIRRSSNYQVVNSVITGFDLWCLEASTAGEIDFYGNSFAGCTSSDPLQDFGDNAFYDDEKSLELNNWIPESGSPLLSGAIILDYFSEDDLLDEFFADAYDVVDNVGAVGEKNWTSWIEIPK